MIETIRSHPGQVSILSLGPMTNLALALHLDPGIVPLTRQVIVMGGPFNLRDPQSEFNVRCDPPAQIVFDSGWDVHILGLDITRRVHFSRADFSSLPAGHPAIDLLRKQAPGWIDRMEEMGWEQGGCALHDAVAAAYLAVHAVPRLERIEDAFPGTFPEYIVRRPDAGSNSFCRDVLHTYSDAFLGEELGDAAAHDTGADDSGTLDLEG